MLACWGQTAGGLLYRGKVDLSDHLVPPAPDPLRLTEPLPLTGRFYPLGFPLELRSNSADILEAACDSWGEFAAAFDVPPIDLRILVGGEGRTPGSTLPEEPVFRAQAQLLAVVLDSANFAMVDMERCFAFACLSASVARDHLFTAFYFLDPMAYTCLSHRSLTPIHAACVARDGKGVLLLGGPGCGKSFLAFACARAGLTFIADDATYVVRHSVEPTLIGKHQRMRFKPDALKLIPELTRFARISTVIGKRSFEIRTAEVPGLMSASCCRPWKSIFLDRRETGPAELLPLAPEETWIRLRRSRTMMEDRVWREQEASLEPVARAGGLVLRYSSLAAAVEEILKIV